MSIGRTIQSAIRNYQTGNFREAESLFTRVLKADPGNYQALLFLGILHYQSGEFDRAVHFLRQAAKSNPSDPYVWNNLGTVLKETGQFDESISCYQKALRLNPGMDQVYSNLGSALQAKGTLDAAIDCYQKALHLNPGLADAYYNLGTALMKKGEPDAAESCLNNAIRLNPNFTESYINLGAISEGKKLLKEAILYYQKALQINPSSAEAHFVLACALMLDGNLDEGWKHYEWRWELKDFPGYNIPYPLWDGVFIPGKTILLHTEQGFGDAIQFIRYAPLVAEKGMKVIVQCQKELATLFEKVNGISSIITDGDTIPEVDFHCPLISLPLIFSTKVATIPAKFPYLTVEQQLIDIWKEKIHKTTSRLRIGLVWAGKTSHKRDNLRSFPPDLFTPLLELQDISLYSLQVGSESYDEQKQNKKLALIDYTREIRDFLDTAAIMENLDLVISADTAAAHLAGALGKPVWLLLPFVPDWRWMLDREDSPWYPTMRLFRQTEPGDWEGIIHRVIKELQNLPGKQSFR